MREKLSTPATAISALPDDLLLECLSRLPTSSLPSLPLVSRRFNRLLSSDSLPFLRRSLGLLNHSFIVVSLSSDLTLLSFSTLPFHPAFSNQSGISANLKPPPCLCRCFWKLLPCMFHLGPVVLHAFLLSVDSTDSIQLLPIDGVLQLPGGPDCCPKTDRKQQWLVFYQVEGLTVKGAGMIEGNGKDRWNLPCKPHKGPNGSTLSGPCDSLRFVLFFILVILLKLGRYCP